MLIVLDLASTACFAFLGANAARKINASNFGVCVSATLLATGGGTTRDLLLRKDTIFWLQDTSYVLMIVVGIVIGMYFKSTTRSHRWIVETAESASTIVFIFVGITAALQVNCHWFFVPFMGGLTGLGGGIIREIIFEGSSKYLSSDNDCKIVLAISSVATLGIYIGVSTMVALFVTLMISLVYRIHIEWWEAGAKHY